MSARLEDVLREHMHEGYFETQDGHRECFCGHVMGEDETYRSHVAAEVRAWITERLTDEELREAVVRSIYGDGLDGAHDIATAALTTIAEHLTNEQEASRG